MRTIPMPFPQESLVPHAIVSESNQKVVGAAIG